MIVLIFLIRRPLVSLYLIFTVVFGYLVSLGLTRLFFGWLYGSTFQGLDWKLKIFLFVILVAVGEESGQLGAMLIQVATVLEGDLQRQIERLVGLRRVLR